MRMRPEADLPPTKTRESRVPGPGGQRELLSAVGATPVGNLEPCPGQQWLLG